MDAFEPIRNAARSLHAEVLERGADPARPRSLVMAAISRLGLELSWLPVGDPQLKGAQGAFDEQCGVICCADVGHEAERTALIAHELGHAYVHSASATCSPEDVDASQSTEMAPVGLQRVEDYNGRERRELQANVFAREFVLPRAEARRLFLREKLPAATIASRLQLPRDLVRQQLLDAVLLPEAPVEPERVAPAARPDDSQDRAARHDGSPFQLQAGPGTGKTRTLVKRVLRLLSEGTDPASILVLTFSNRAAGELSERISAVAPEAGRQVWIGTFHAFGLDLIRRYHQKFALPPAPTLFDRSDAIEVLEELLPTLPLKHYRNLWDPALVLREIVTAISRAKDELADPGQYRRLAERMLDRATDLESRESAEKAIEVADVYDLYERELRQRGSVDFGDLVMRPALLLERDVAVRTAVQLRHRHVLVDEYQDVNRASARLLHAVAGDGARLWVVGDARQSIYRFRGASSTNVSAFPREYAAAAVDRLEVNYRSSTEIVAALVQIAPHLVASQGMLPLVLTSDRGATGVKPQILRFETPSSEPEGIAASVQSLVAAGVPFRDQAVLCRSNARLNEIAGALEARGIPVLHLGSFFEREEIRDLLALLSLVIDRFGDGLARVAVLRRYDLSLQDVRTATQQLRENARPAARNLRDVAASGALSEHGSAGLQRLADDLEGMTGSKWPWEVLTTFLLDRTDLLAEIANGLTVASRMRGLAVWQFLNFVRDRGPVGPGQPIRRMLDRVRQLVLLAEERDLRQVPPGGLHIDAVRLMTVHGSKGLEFEAVHIPGLTVSSFPTSNRGQRCPAPDGMVESTGGGSSADESKRAHDSEEECLFFVAASRARTHLRLYLARTQANGKKRSPSRFIEWFTGALASEVPQPATLSLPAGSGQPTAVAIVWPSGWHVTDAWLRTYEKCPRRFFYTHVLELGSARRPTAFSRTHDCLYELIAWLTAARVDAVADEAAAQREFDRLWQSHGPVDHAYAAEYRRLADRLVGVLVRLGAGHRFRQADELAIDLAGGRILVRPDEMAELADGTIVLRRVRTGHKRKDEYDRLDYSLYHLAARQHYPSNYRVEALHLTDEAVEPVDVSDGKIDARREKSEEMLSGIAVGAFPPVVDAVACPRCPHFFVCAATPRGPLSLL